MNQTINNLLTEQLASWETARNNYAALSGVQVKELDVNGIPYPGQSVPYLSSPSDDTGSSTREPAHSRPFQGYAGIGTGVDGLHNIL